MIDPRLDPLGLLVGDRAQVGALWDVPPDQPVLVFITSTLAWSVWVAIVNLCALTAEDAALYPFSVGKLRAVVAGN